MKRYRVVDGAAQIGQGEVIGLSKEQYRRRQHRLDGETVFPLDLEQIQKHGDIVVCRARELIEFKEGEEILLPTAPSKAQALHLAPVDHDDGLRRQPPVATTPAPAKKARAARA